MADLKLSQSFSMVALNAQDSLYMTTSKRVALRCMAAAVILETYIDGSFTGTDDKLTIKNDAPEENSVMPYREAIFKPMLYKNSGIKGNLKWWLKKASMLPKGKLIIFEHTMTDSLKETNLLEEIPGLLGCDLFYVTSGVAIKEYRSNIQEYLRITENIRAEILEDGQVTNETICMLWLLRESGCMHDLFSRNELEKVASRMDKLCRNSLLAKTVFQIRIHRGFEIAIKEFLRMKKAVFRTSFGSGINFAFPILERSQSVFIDTEEWFSDPQKRLEDVKSRIVSNGHAFAVLHEGPISLLKIDNIVYEAIPQAVIVTKVPIHGVRLLPKYPTV